MKAAVKTQSPSPTVLPYKEDPDEKWRMENLERKPKKLSMTKTDWKGNGES